MDCEQHSPTFSTYLEGSSPCPPACRTRLPFPQSPQAHPNSVALFVPAEITTYCFYPGRVKDYLVANAIFRMGGAAVLCTNKPSLASKAKYQLLHNVRVHTGQDDAAYNCISWGPDPEGINGVYLGKDVPQQAGIMLEAVIKAITPKIMTWGQYAEAAHFMFNKKVMKNPAYKRYMPDYTQCVDHFALHAGGYAVLKGIQKGMNLPVEAVLPSFASLRDYGNTSSSTTWYTIAYLESVGAVKKGHQIMQVGVMESRRVTQGLAVCCTGTGEGAGVGERAQSSTCFGTVWVEVGCVQEPVGCACTTAAGCHQGHATATALQPHINLRNHIHYSVTAA